MKTLPRTLRTLPCSEVHKWDNNPAIRLRKDARHVEMTDHIRRYGQLDPVDVVQEADCYYRIVRGHRRYAIIADELHWQFIDAWVWFLPFQEARDILVPTERMQRPMVGRDIGQVVIALGMTGAAPILRLDDARVLQDAADHLAAEMELFWSLCGRYGPRVFAKLLPLVSDYWPLERIARAVLRRGSYRDIERKGLNLAERWAILCEWEKMAEGVSDAS